MITLSQNNSKLIQDFLGLTILSLPKRRFKKVYLDLVIPPCNWTNYTKVTIEYSEYDNSLDVQGSETPSGVAVQTYVSARSKL